MIRALIISAIFLSMAGQAYAHGGRTDKNGGHNCSAKSKKKGLCTGYHYHNNDKLYINGTDELAAVPQDSTNKHKHTGGAVN